MRCVCTIAEVCPVHPYDRLTTYMGVWRFQNYAVHAILLATTLPILKRSKELTVTSASETYWWSEEAQYFMKA
jgi:hypothetical protein